MKSQERFGLSDQVITKIHSALAQHPGIEKIILYGSRAKGTYRAGSDIDLTLFGKSLTTTDLFKIENDLEALSLPYKIDLSLHHQLDHPDLLEHIARVGVEFGTLK